MKVTIKCEERVPFLPTKVSQDTVVEVYSKEDAEKIVMTAYRECFVAVRRGVKEEMRKNGVFLDERGDLLRIDCPALEDASALPERFGGRVPRTVRMLRDVKSDLDFFLRTNRIERSMVARSGEIYPAWTNRLGAVCVQFANGERLGVKPDEFEVHSYYEKQT